ncbi:Ig-like domain-containing protein [Bradyrhizobium ottawaense]|uniref:Ig-like domain-containing protein n=2 Tax=Bradyrhizobium ottawaense TaxID=931866 RepID=UPI003391C4B5
MVITQAGAVVSGLNITGSVYIKADNVTLENCKITSGGWAGVTIDSGATGAVVQNCTIDGTGRAPDGTGNQGIMGSGTFIGNNIYNVENGIVPGSNSVIQGNYIHDLQAGGSPHYDGIQIDGGLSNIQITGNSIINQWGWTSAVMIDNDFGPVSNVTVTNNLLTGGAYTVYADSNLGTASITGVSFTNNHIGGAQYGDALIRGNNSVFSGNYTDGAALASALNTSANSGTTTTSPTMPPATPEVPAAPSIASWSPDTGKTGDGITDAGQITLHGTAAAGSTVKVYDGSTQIGTATATSTGSWDYITKVLTDAKHTLTATATNSSGQTSVASTAVAVTVDTKAPAAPAIASDTVNTANQVVMSGTAEVNSAIKVFDGTTQVGTATTNASGAWSVTTSALSAGSHALTAKATDVAGNVSAASAAVDAVVGSGTTTGSTGSGTSGSGTSGTGTTGTGTSGTGTTAPAAPKIASFSNDTGTAGDHITSDKTVALAGTAAANSTVKVLDGTTQLGTVTADANGAWHYTTAALPDGKHSFTATDTVSGVTSKASAALDVTVDSAAPDAPILLSDPTTHNRATVSGTAEAGSSIKLYEGTTLLGTATVASDGDWSVTTPNLKHGSHTFTATATDAAGNTSALSQPIDPPIGHGGTKDAATVEVTNVRQHWDHTATIKGTADPNSEIKLSDGTTSVGSVTTGADGKWSFQTSDLSGKSHAFTAEQVDTTGHVVGTSSGAAMIGSGRSDTLTGTTGNDVMVGKAGADTFQFASNFGQDVIKDFAARGPAHDTIEFSKSVFDSFASVLSHAAQSGHDVVIATGSDTLTLKNTQLDKLNSHDFHFA